MYALTQWLPGGVELNVNSAILLSLIFFAASFVAIPRTFLCLGAGASLGILAVLIILPSTMFGGILAFVLARHLFSARLQTYIDAHARLRRIAAAEDEEGWRVVALLRYCFSSAECRSELRVRSDVHRFLAFRHHNVSLYDPPSHALRLSWVDWSRRTAGRKSIDVEPGPV